MDLSRIPEPLRSKLQEQLGRLPSEARAKLEAQLARVPAEQLEAVFERTAPLFERLAQKSGKSGTLRFNSIGKVQLGAFRYLVFS